MPNAGRRRLWSVEDAPNLTLLLEERLLTYRRIRDALSTQMALEFRFPGRMLAVVPQHK